MSYIIDLPAAEAFKNKQEFSDADSSVVRSSNKYELIYKGSEIAQRVGDNFKIECSDMGDKERISAVNAVLRTINKPLLITKNFQVWHDGSIWDGSQKDI